MITNFEEITAKLTERELNYLPLINITIEKHTKILPITTETLKKIFGLKPERIRCIINALRSAGCPILAYSKGYYYSTDKSEIRLTIQSLEDRIRGISNAKCGLENYLKFN